jgi:hypothetical protein
MLLRAQVAGKSTFARGFVDGFPWCVPKPHRFHRIGLAAAIREARAGRLACSHRAAQGVFFARFIAPWARWSAR